jgi:hypothetical protein
MCGSLPGNKVLGQQKTSYSWRRKGYLGSTFASRFRDPVVTRAAQNQIRKPVSELLMPPFAASMLCKSLHFYQIWRKRVGVEPTIRPAKGRIAGFEGREDHRTPFASEESIGSGADSFNCGGSGFGANQRCNQVVELGAGADFVVGMRRGYADFSVRQKFASQALAQNEQFH